jgi:hypothetical protein
MALKRGNIFVVEMKWFDNSIIKWRKQPEKDYLIDRKRNSSRAATPDIAGHSKERSTAGIAKEKIPESSITLKKPNLSDKSDQVSALERADEDGTNRESSHFVNSTDNVDGLPEDGQTDQEETMELTIDWAQIDKELEDELGSDIDEESETGSRIGSLTDDGTLE